MSRRVKVKDICTLVRGSSPRPQGDARYYSGSVPRLMIEDITRDGMYVTPRTDSLTEAGAALSRPMKKNDLVMTVSGRTGVPAILNVDACIHDGFVGFRELSKDVSVVYLYHYFSFLTDKTNSQSVGAIFKNLTTDQIKELDVPLPTLGIQKQIADTLDKADALRQKDQQLLQKYDELAQSIFYEMFGDPERNERSWQESKLETLCIDIVDCPHSTPKHSETVTQFPCIRTSELSDGEINWSSMKYVDEGEYRFRTKRLVPLAGDIVYGREGTFGEAIIIRSGYKMCLGQRTMLFRPNYERVTSTFLWYQLRSDFVYKQALRKNNGSTVGHVNVADIKKFRILVPPLILQRQFDTNLKKAFESRQLLQSSSNNSEQLFNGLLQTYFV
jgi:type I restriction enzyme S subunit